MKNSIFILLLSFVTLTSAVKKEEIPAPAITFETLSHDFGTLKQDEITQDYVFTFKNTGNAPLIINEVEKPCGCTHPEWSKEPVMPGKTGYVSVRFSAKGQPIGVFRKTLNVYSNINQERTPILMIKGSIEKGKVVRS
ncbi:MAG: DUF1573 domain-containing protein [Sphingobacteriales bacterium]|nr:MAG: DUF1573 domain-containing protein [Sphingobacteriales bacterium]